MLLDLLNRKSVLHILAKIFGRGFLNNVFLQYICWLINLNMEKMSIRICLHHFCIITLQKRKVAERIYFGRIGKFIIFT